MKKAMILATAAALFTLVGCKTYKGGVPPETVTQYGTASELRSPGGLDYSRGTTLFNTMPPLPPETNVPPSYPSPLTPH